MGLYTADLHVHTVLSPCGDLDMSPAKIIAEAKARHIDILGISDHNSTRHCRLVQELGEEEGIFVMPGAEINSKEEIHCLTFFENLDSADKFQEFLDAHLPAFPNDPERFGEQVVVDRNEQIIAEIVPLLINALDADIYEIQAEVQKLGGLFIPAHIDRPYNSMLSQLGFIPPDLQVDALEVSASTSCEHFLELHPELGEYTIITNSDAHYLHRLGAVTTRLELESLSFREIKMALAGQDGRKTRVR